MRKAERVLFAWEEDPVVRKPINAISRLFFYSQMLYNAEILH